MAEQRKTIRIGTQAPPPRPQPVDEGAMPRPTVRPGFGTLPFNPSVFLTGEEVQKLARLGWKPGDPIPPNLSQALKAEWDVVQQDINESLPVDPTTPPVRVPPPVDIDKLPPERQQALREFMAGYKRMQEQLAQGVTDDSLMTGFVPTDPSVAQAMSQAGMINVVDSGVPDRGTVIGGPKTPEHPSWPDNPAAQKAAADKAHWADSRQPDPGPIPGGLAAPPTNSAGGAAAPQHCPRCNWKLVQPVELEPESSDKMVFLQALLSRQRFKKAFSLYGGHVQVTFKSLAINEAELCLSQIAYDQRDDKIVSYDQAAVALMDYRLALSIDSYKVGDEFMELPDGLEGWEEVEGSKPGKGAPQTKLPMIVEWLQKQTPLGREHVWRQVGQASQRFHRLADHLESRSHDADFWKAIEDAV